MPNRPRGPKSWLDRRFAPWAALAWSDRSRRAPGCSTSTCGRSSGTTNGSGSPNAATSRRRRSWSLTTSICRWVPVAVYRLLFETVRHRRVLALPVAARGGSGVRLASPSLSTRVPRVGPVLALAAARADPVPRTRGAEHPLALPDRLADLRSGRASGRSWRSTVAPRRADAWAALLLGVALASSGIGIPFVVAAAVDVALQRRRWARRAGSSRFPLRPVRSVVAGLPGGGTRCSPRARRRAALGIARGLRVAARAPRPGATSFSRRGGVCAAACSASFRSCSGSYVRPGRLEAVAAWAGCRHG